MAESDETPSTARRPVGIRALDHVEDVFESMTAAQPSTGSRMFAKDVDRQRSLLPDARAREPKASRATLGVTSAERC